MAIDECGCTTEVSNYKIISISFHESGNYLYVEDLKMKISFKIKVSDIHDSSDLIGNFCLKAFEAINALHNLE